MEFAAPEFTYLTHRGYAIPKQGNEALVERLKDLLTVSPKVNPGMPNMEQTSFSLYLESTSNLYIPKYYGLSTFGAPSQNRLSIGADAPGLVFQGNMREEQRAPVEAFLKAARDPEKMGGIISIQCGGGKTVIGLYLASVFKKRTLIVCHKEFLMNQWRERISQFLPKAKVGLIKQSKVDIHDKDIVIASLQSLAMRDYDPAIFKTFGFVAYDECHHNGAAVFSKSMQKMTIPVTLGLSATLNRKDGLRKVFEWYLGKPVFKNTKRDDKQMIVHSHPFYDPHPDYGRELKMFHGKLNVAGMITAITAFPPRTVFILDILHEVLKCEPTRKTLILSDRRAHLKELERLILIRKMGSVGYYVGGMKEEQLKESESKDIILGTFVMACEGMDIPALNTLVLASPISAIEQPIGRVQRQKPHERTHTPLVIDIWDQFSLFNRQGAKRIAFYKKQGYEVIHADRTDDSSDTDEPKKPKKYDFIDDDDE